MCHFITLGLPPSAETRSKAEFGRGFTLYPTTNVSIRRNLPTDFLTRVITSGMCSCELYARPGLPWRGPSDEELRAKFQKRSWSEAKINRAVSQSTAKPKAGLFASHGLRSDIAEKFVTLAEAEGPIAFVVHWYSGDVEKERFAVTCGPRYRGARFLDAAETLLPDVMIWVAPD